MPEKTPKADVNFELLADHKMTGGNIQNAVFRAASRAALRDEEKRNITHGDLELAVKEEMSKNFGQNRLRKQDSNAVQLAAAIKI